MPHSFTGEEFAQALASDTIRESVVLIGMAKKSDDDPDSVQFAPGTVCQNWTPIPVAMIDRVEVVRQVPCDDHAHSLVRLSLKDSGTPEYSVLATLLNRYAQQSASPCGSGTPPQQPDPRSPAAQQPPAQWQPPAQQPPRQVSPPAQLPPGQPYAAGAATGPGMAAGQAGTRTAQCVDGSSTCWNYRCWACCNGQWWEINDCLYGVNFSCNGVHYNAYNCWPIA